MTSVVIQGYGAVASVHARHLKQRGAAQLIAVCGPNIEKARKFAEKHGIPAAYTEAPEADVVIICSPSSMHAQHALEAMRRGSSVLVELPPCTTHAEAETLARVSRQWNSRLACAHTSRYLEPYRKVESALSVLGPIRHVSYMRHLRPRERSWTDDALLHHAQHPLDLLLKWFGDVRPAGIVGAPASGCLQEVSLLAELPGGAPVSIDISYSAHLPFTRMTLVAPDGAIATDGFSYLESNIDALNWKGDATESYERAIGDQDAAFLNGSEVRWEETSRLIALVETFRRLQ